VTFRDGDTVLAVVTMASTRATFSTTSLAVGAHTITATYSGDAGYQSSVSAALAQQVN
jgi:hypothetical protein